MMGCRRSSRPIARRSCAISRAHGAGDAAEDLLQELWLKAAGGISGPIASPRSYLFRAATNLMIDRRRSEAQQSRRERDWSDLSDRLPGSPANDPGPERLIDGRREARFRRGRACQAAPSRSVYLPGASFGWADAARNRGRLGPKRQHDRERFANGLPAARRSQAKAR